MKHRGRWLAPAIVIGALLLIEILLRLIGAGVPPPRYCADGSPRGRFGYGVRNRYVDSIPADTAHYVVCFGDSWTFGLGVTADEAWPARLETLLKKHDANARVVNAAVAHAVTADVARVFRPLIIRYRARQVVIFVGAQDATPLDLLKAHPLGEPFHQGDCPRPWFRLGHWFSRRWFAFQLRLHPLDPVDNKLPVERRSSMTATQMNLLALAQTASELGVTAVFVTYPTLPPGAHDMPLLPLENRYNFLIHAAAAAFSLPEVDLEKRWGDRTERYLLPWLIWPHPNAAGHADIAKAIAAAL
jgi:lysophospholipase L1-like esterase